jgi:dsRNA-specific ribonuclease
VSDEINQSGVSKTDTSNLSVSGWEEASLLSHAGRRGYATPASMDFLNKLRELCCRHKWTVEIIDPNELENPDPNEECWAQHIVVNGHEKATGRARNKRMARNDAAQQLYERLKASKLSSENVGDSPTGWP